MVNNNEWPQLKRFARRNIQIVHEWIILLVHKLYYSTYVGPVALLTCSTSSRWGNGLGYLYQPNVAYNHLFYIPFDNAKFAYHCLLKLLSYSYTKRWLFYCSYLNKVLINGRAHTKAPSLTIYVIKFLQSTTHVARSSDLRYNPRFWWRRDNFLLKLCAL